MRPNPNSPLRQPNTVATADDRTRFEDKIEKLPGEDACWEWQSSLVSGYGTFWFLGAPRKSHQMAWFLSFGALPPEAVVCHDCDNRKCVRPDHLFLGSDQDNLWDALAKNRPVQQNTGKEYSRLTDEDKRDICALRQTGASQNFLADTYNVSRRHIRNILQ